MGRGLAQERGVLELLSFRVLFSIIFQSEILKWDTGFSRVDVPYLSDRANDSGKTQDRLIFTSISVFGFSGLNLLAALFHRHPFCLYSSADLNPTKGRGNHNKTQIGLCKELGHQGPVFNRRLGMTVFIMYAQYVRAIEKHSL